MARLIDVVNCAECIHYENGKCEMWEYDVVKPCGFCWCGRTADGREPAEIDAVPVVRCKDCKYRIKEGERFYELVKGLCTLNENFVPDDFYCAEGKKQTYREMQDK
jgi:hypothetical protein